MLCLQRVLVVFVGIICLTACAAMADPKIDQEVLGTSGKWPGYAVSLRGIHTAVLLKKGSRFVVALDGAEGPRIDKMVNLNGDPYYVSTSGQANSIPVLFSDDGTHNAYYGVIDDEYVVMLDGKELTRGKYTSSTLTSGQLTFTAGDKHLFYAEIPADGGYQIVMDGKPGPKSHTPIKVAFSADGDHYAYVGTEADGMDTPWAVVDGKQVKYFGGDLQFTAKGHLVALLKGKGQAALNIDGHIALVGTNITQIQLSPTGGQLAAMVFDAGTNKTMLSVNGKTVPGTEGILLQSVYFSPDDKRYAALCTAIGGGQYVILDGKKGQKYDAINGGSGALVNGAYAGRAWANGVPPGAQMAADQVAPAFPCFTADSNFIYVAQSAGQQFLVTNEDESDGYKSISPVLSPDGKRVAFITSAGYGMPTVVVDGKTIALKARAGVQPQGTPSLSFSPDSAHYLITAGGSTFLDGVEVPDLVCAGQCFFSPDSQHVLAMGSSAANPTTRYGIFLDGKLVSTTDLRNPTRPIFSPDSKHVFWFGSRSPETSTDFDTAVLWVDGEPTALHTHEISLTVPSRLEVSSDDVLTFVAQMGDELKRYHITPDPDTSLTTMLANAK